MNGKVSKKIHKEAREESGGNNAVFHKLVKDKKKAYKIKPEQAVKPKSSRRSQRLQTNLDNPLNVQL